MFNQIYHDFVFFKLPGHTKTTITIRFFFKDDRLDEHIPDGATINLNLKLK